MTYSIRLATVADIPHFVMHRTQMFRDMGIRRTASGDWDAA